MVSSTSQQGLFKKIFTEADNSPLIVFRIIFGFLLFYYCVASVLNGTVYENFIQPPFTFTFIGFEFLQPLPGLGMYFYFGLMALLALSVMAGAWYRFSITAFTLLWLVLYLMQKSNYNNHHYLILLLCFLMIFMPANRYYSVDVKRKAVSEKLSCSNWVIWIFIAQIFIVYFFSAMSKLAAPDWLSGKFLTIQFSLLSKNHLVGFIYGQSWFPVLISYGGFVFDLLIVPLLLWKKTRPYAFALACVFHIFNSFTFFIGIFPYLSIALNIFFFPAEKVRGFFFKKKQIFFADKNYVVKKALGKKILLCGLAIYIIIQIILPMRPWFFQGNVFWTDEGNRMSWKMMLRTKSGNVFFKITDSASGKTWRDDPAKAFAPSHVRWLSTSPDMIWQYAQKLKNKFVNKGYPHVKIYAVGWVSLNRSAPQPLVNPGANLASAKWYVFKHSDWIMPFKENP